MQSKAKLEDVVFLRGGQVDLSLAAGIEKQAFSNEPAETIEGLTLFRDMGVLFSMVGPKVKGITELMTLDKVNNLIEFGVGEGA